MLILATVFLLGGTVWAGHISLNTRYVFPSMITGDNFSVQVGVTNTGDEAAYDVIINPMLSDSLITQPLSAGNKLEANASFDGILDVKLRENITPGEYALIVLTDYKDANGYSFSSIHIPPEKLLIKKHSNSLVSGSIKEITLPVDGMEKNQLMLRNLEEKKHIVKTKLYLPRELYGQDGDETVILEPRGEQVIDFVLTSKGALAGSKYVIYALIEYEEDNLHYTSTATGMVSIVETDEQNNIPGYVIMVFVLAALALFIGYQFIAGKAKGGEETD